MDLCLSEKSRVDSTKVSHPHPCSRNNTPPLFVSSTTSLSFALQLQLQIPAQMSASSTLPPRKLQSKIYSLFNKLTSAWRQSFSLLLDSGGSGDEGGEQTVETDRDRDENVEILTSRIKLLVSGRLRNNKQGFKRERKRLNMMPHLHNTQGVR